jgi:hypothetical protein
MSRLSSRLLGPAVATGILVLTGLCPAQQASKTGSGAELTRYREWIKVNSKRVRFAAAPATQCASAFPSQIPSPHRDKFITVYVNPMGRKAMLQERAPAFPVGAMIVKEKYTTTQSRTPELMTAMRKRTPGYDSNNGDWEYLVLEGKTGKVQEQGHLTKCQECHHQVGSTDFVFRTPYLSQVQEKRLKPAPGTVHSSH